MTTPVPADDPQVQMLARWLERAQLSNGQPCPLPPGGLTDLLAEAIINRLVGMVWCRDTNRWIPVEGAGVVDVQDVQIEQLDEHAVRMTHTPTGLVALETSHDAAWNLLRHKVKEASRAHRPD